MRSLSLQDGSVFGLVFGTGFMTVNHSFGTVTVNLVFEPWRLTKLNSALGLTLKIVEVCQDDSDNGPLASINEEMHVMIPEYKIK